jgi:ubiquitin-protein ligase
LLYSNPHDPLNPEAASLMLKAPEQYREKVLFYVNKYAQQD